MAFGSVVEETKMVMPAGSERCNKHWVPLQFIYLLVNYGDFSFKFCSMILSNIEWSSLYIFHFYPRIVHMKHVEPVSGVVSFCGLIFDSATPTAYCVRIFVMNWEGFERKLLWTFLVSFAAIL